MSKINRVTYGLLLSEDLVRYEVRTGNNRSFIPLSRRLLAVPFEGKDKVTLSSEFAHPEVLIGLSILAYRYEGLREMDARKLVKALKEALIHEPGATVDRPTWLMFHDWLAEALKDKRVKNLHSSLTDHSS